MLYRHDRTLGASGHPDPPIVSPRTGFNNVSYVNLCLSSHQLPRLYKQASTDKRSQPARDQVWDLAVQDNQETHYATRRQGSTIMETVWLEPELAGAHYVNQLLS